MNTKNLQSIGVTKEQYNALKKGEVIIVNGVPFFARDGKLFAGKTINSTKARFNIFHFVPASNATLHTISNKATDNAIEEYLKHGEDSAYTFSYASNGVKKENGDPMPLDEQIEKGVARKVKFRLTRSMEHAYKNEFGAYEAYEGKKDGVTYYLRDDIEEVTEGLKQSFLEPVTEVSAYLIQDNALSF